MDGEQQRQAEEEAAEQARQQAEAEARRAEEQARRDAEARRDTDAEMYDEEFEDLGDAAADEQSAAGGGAKSAAVAFTLFSGTSPALEESLQRGAVLLRGEQLDEALRLLVLLGGD